MAEEKFIKSIRFDSDEIEMIKQFKSENNIDTFSSALKTIVRKFFENSDSDDTCGEVLKKINRIDSEIQILNELAGELFYVKDIKSILYGSKSDGYEAAKKVVDNNLEKRIVNKRF